MLRPHNNTNNNNNKRSHDVSTTLSGGQVKRVRAAFAQGGSANAAIEIRNILGHHANPELEFEILRLLEEERIYNEKRGIVQLEPPQQEEEEVNVMMMAMETTSDGIFCPQCGSSSGLGQFAPCTFVCGCGLMLFDAGIHTLHQLRLRLEWVFEEHARNEMHQLCTKSRCDFLFGGSGESWVSCDVCRWRVQVTQGR